MNELLLKLGIFQQMRIENFLLKQHERIHCLNERIRNQNLQIRNQNQMFDPSLLQEDKNKKELLNPKEQIKNQIESLRKSLSQSNKNMKKNQNHNNHKRKTSHQTNQILQRKEMSQRN